MTEEDPISLLVSFQDLPDPRVEGRCDHKLIDIIVITVCAVIAGAERGGAMSKALVKPGMSG